MHFCAFVPLVALVAGGVCQATTETRSLDQIHQAALKEGGVVTLWHGGSEQHQQDALKNAFERRFPGMTLNITVRSSSFIGPDIDLQLATESVIVDNVYLQTLQDYPRWKHQGALLNYKPAGFKQVYDVFKDSDGAWASSTVNAWSIVYNKDKLKGIEPPTTFLDFLKPEFKNKLIFTSPIDDDAVLNTFELIIKKYGVGFFWSLLAQNPRWAPHHVSIANELGQPNTTYAATFGTTIGLVSQDPLEVHFPTEGAPFTSWAQGAAILKDAPHPEGAKLLQSYVLSEEYQNQTGSWSIRRDVPSPDGFSSIFDTPNTNPLDFVHWMSDRQTVERWRFWFQDKIGYPA
ncbi:periplasmic binding protein-like II [Xylaria telfairii]|nr:periplasmic binding protein-like II [Xylaria telfairii]